MNPNFIQNPEGLRKLDGASVVGCAIIGLIGMNVFSAPKHLNANKKPENLTQNKARNETKTSSIKSPKTLTTS